MIPCSRVARVEGMIKRPTRRAERETRRRQVIRMHALRTFELLFPCNLLAPCKALEPRKRPVNLSHEGREGSLHARAGAVSPVILRQSACVSRTLDSETRLRKLDRLSASVAHEICRHQGWRRGLQMYHRMRNVPCCLHFEGSFFCRHAVELAIPGKREREGVLRQETCMI